MKKVLLLLILGITLNGFNNLTKAQGYFNQPDENKIRFGFKAGANYTNLGTIDAGVFLGEEAQFLQTTIFKTDYKAGFQAGLYAQIPIGDSFLFMPEINLIRKGAKLQDSARLEIFGFEIGAISYKLSSTFYYLDLPLMFGFRPTSALTIYAGPQASYLVYQNLKMQIEDDPEENIPGTENLEKLLLGGAAGAAYQISSNISINGRYMMDFQSVFKKEENQPKMRHSGFALSIGYSF
jgi:hypothetical protein